MILIVTRTLSSFIDNPNRQKFKDIKYLLSETNHIPLKHQRMRLKVTPKMATIMRDMKAQPKDTKHILVHTLINQRIMAAANQWIMNI